MATNKRSGVTEKIDDLVRAATSAYELLADIHHEWNGRNTDRGQALLVSLRESIAAVTEEDAEQIQDEASCSGAYAYVQRAAISKATGA